MNGESRHDVTEEEFWQDGYNLGHKHGLANLPNMLDFLASMRPSADVIPFRRYRPSTTAN